VFAIDDDHNAVISAAAEAEQQVRCDLLIARETVRTMTQTKVREAEKCDEPPRAVYHSHGD